ncbi:MAG: hypothetical protein JRC86_12835 [Deltaproteobacteria bacterium]|nr:hypothetical protein [Deltaproteobacteria bacterium]
MAYGEGGHLGISFQNSLGMSLVTSMEYFPMLNETLTENIESLMSESLSSRYEEPDEYEGMHGIEGDTVHEVHPKLVGKLLKAWCGQHSMDGYQGSCYQHTFLPGTTDFTEGVAALPPVSIEVYRDTGSAYLYYDMMCNQLVFEMSHGGLYKVTASWIGAQFDWLAKSTPAYDAGSLFTWDTTSISLADAAVDDASQLTFAFNNNLAAKAFLDGNKYPGRILRDGHRTMEISGTLLLNGDTEARNYKNRTQQRLIMTATDPSTVMNYHHQLVIDVPKMLYTEFPANISGPGLIDVGFSAKGKYDVTSDYAAKFTLVNTHAAY